LFSLAGPTYVIVAFLGRLPLAMSQLGTLLMVSTATGRYTAGGLAAGALAIANAVGAPIAGGIADRVGQRPVVLAQSLTAGAALVALVISVSQDASLPVVVAIAALAGLSIPQVGPLARVRWRPMTRPAGDAQPRLVDAAFSYEGAADEASFVLGPALVGVIAVVINPGGALLTAAAMLAVFGCWFALHPTARLTRPARRALAAVREKLVSGALVALFVAQLLIGMIFGATQTGTTVLATAEGRPGLAGLVHAVLGVSSVITGLAVAGLSPRFTYERRLAVFAAALFGLSVPLLMVGSLAAVVPAIFALGLAVAPYMITVFTLAERIVPVTRVGAAMTLLAGATGIGYALGSGIAGRVADLGGHRPAFAVTVAAALSAAVLASAVRARLRRAQERPAVLVAEPQPV
jgi:MFS family permease